MDTRTIILNAAATVFAQHGFRGSTTRRIADVARVNEVTIFRYFGSKDALLQEAVSHSNECQLAEALPARPVDPEAELTLWCATAIDYLRSRQTMIRKCMSEMDERPEMRSGAAATPTRLTNELCAYFRKLRREGFTDEDFDATAAAAMTMGAIFHDAMGRELMPDAFPKPASKAPQRYARLVLRAIGVGTSSVTSAPGQQKAPKQTPRSVT